METSSAASDVTAGPARDEAVGTIKPLEGYRLWLLVAALVASDFLNALDQTCVVPCRRWERS